MNNQTANTFIIDFNKKWVNTKNSTYLIENEIRQIELYVSTNYIPQNNQRGNFASMINQVSKTNSVFQLNHSHSTTKEKFNTYFNQNLLDISLPNNIFSPK